MQMKYSTSRSLRARLRWWSTAASTMWLAAACSGSQQGAAHQYPETTENEPGYAATPSARDPHTRTEETPAHEPAPARAESEVGTSKSAQTLDDSEVKVFAQTYAKIMTIPTDYQQNASAASSRTEIDTLQEEMQQEMHEAVESHGLTPQTFDTIVQMVERDPALRERVERELQELQ